MATVRLGMEVGVEQVIDVLQRLGFDEPITAYPSLLLGAVQMTPVQVAGIYTALASGGFRTPLQAVQAVTAADGRPLQRYPIEVEQAAAQGDVYQLNQGLVTVMQRGTGRSAGLDLRVAGKTGTSNEFRDSWFAGFSGDRIAVVWVGYDDNRPTGYSGASGALRIWSPLMRDVAAVPYAPLPPAGLASRRVDYYSGAGTGPRCDSAVELALPGDVRLPRGGCTGGRPGLGERTMQWLNDVFN